jgi:hypothetical protein
MARVILAFFPRKRAVFWLAAEKWKNLLEKFRNIVVFLWKTAHFGELGGSYCLADEVLSNIGRAGLS